MEHNESLTARTCETCRYWSDMLAMAQGGGPVRAVCLSAMSPMAGQWMAGAQTCKDWETSFYGVIDEPGGEPWI